MKIAITDIKDYNEAILRYEWLDLEGLTADEISGFIEKFLAKRSQETGELHEEWFVTDYEEFANLGEYPSLDELEEAARLSSEHGWEPVTKYYEQNGSLEGFEEAFAGLWDDEEDFAYDLAHDCYSIEQLGSLADYIDWERFARDLFINDFFSAKLSDYRVAVFRR